MYHENSWGDGKQCLEEYYYLSLHFLTGSRTSQKAQVKVLWNNSTADSYWFERITRTVRTDDNRCGWHSPSHSNGWNFYQADSLSHSNRWHFFFERIAKTVQTDNNFFERIACAVWTDTKSLSQLSVILSKTNFTGFNLCLRCAMHQGWPWVFKLHLQQLTHNLLI